MVIVLPAGFVDLQTATDRLNEDLNIMGVVVDFLPPSRSRGTDYMSTFTLADSTLGGYDDGLKVKFFRPMESELPSVQGTGDVVILRAVRVKIWSGMKLALSGFHTGWTVLPAAGIPESVGSNRANMIHRASARMPPPTVAETIYAITLCNSKDRSGFTAPIELRTTTDTKSPVLVSSAVVSLRNKFSLIKDVKIDTFYDVVGQVIRKHSGNGRCELYVTDYTSNNLMYNYEWGRSEEEGIARDGDEHGYLPKHSKNRHWPGPWGKMTLQVALWEPHSSFAMQGVKDEDWIHLRSLRVKLGQDGKLEGCLHTDRRYPDRVDVTVLKELNDDRVKDVIRRKREYWAKFKAQSSDFVELVRGQKRKQGDGTEGPAKGRGKKRKQQQQQQQQQQKASREVEIMKAPALDRYEMNKHIRCNHPLVRPTSIDTILSNDSHETTTPSGVTYHLPFQNIRTRASVRVVDYFPPNLADFAVPCKVSEYDVLSDNDSADSDVEMDENRRQWDDGHGWGGKTRWEWRFYLLLEDAKSSPTDGVDTRLSALVADKDAEMLLKLNAEKYIPFLSQPSQFAFSPCMRPLTNTRSLHQNPTALATLREKLFILWGDLEERKATEMTALRPRDANKGQNSAALDRKAQVKDAAPPVAKPFICCLKEYGVKSKTGERNVLGPGVKVETGQAAVDAEGWERRWRLFGTVIM